MSSLSLAWVGDASGVSLTRNVKESRTEGGGDWFGCLCSHPPGAAGVDNVSGAAVHGAFCPVQPLQEVRKTRTVAPRAPF